MTKNKTNDIEKLRHSFRPDKITVLFVGESAPAGGTYFYLGNSQVYRYLKRAFNGDEKFLSEFKEKGYFLDDLVLEPINDKTRAARRRFHENAVSSLAERLTVYRPLAVISLLKFIEEPVRDAVLMAGLSQVPYFSVPFPGNGRQKEFEQEIARIIPLLP